jgi:hypothetical protein
MICNISRKKYLNLSAKCLWIANTKYSKIIAYANGLSVYMLWKELRNDTRRRTQSIR